MELIFQDSKMGVAETAFTPEGIKITFVHRTKSLIVVYYGQKIIAECRNREAALQVVSEHRGEVTN